jgi:hypothetical protein
MKGKRLVIMLLIAGISLFFVGAAINAEEACKEDVIEMKNEKAFASHKFGIVMFSHGKHYAPKPDGYGIGCGDCHHDKDGKPLTDLKVGDEVQSCFECHSKTEKPKKEKGMSDDEWTKLQLEYYYGAIHMNCVDCHKKEGKGPVKCTECHPKPEKK